MSDVIASDIEDILRRLEISGNSVKITEQLDRDLYVHVNKVLERLGGKWNRSARVHIFPSDPTERLNAVLKAGKLDPKVKTGYFPTPSDIARRMIEMLDLQPDDIVLEPSAGTGSILDELPKGTKWVIGEILPENIIALKEKGYAVDFENFLGVKELKRITKVVMNPPFENQADIVHVTHALKMLQPGGVLVSIMAPSITFRENKRTSDFMAMLDAGYTYEIINLPAGSFKDAGTGVNTILLKAVKANAPVQAPPAVFMEIAFEDSSSRFSAFLLPWMGLAKAFDKISFIPEESRVSNHLRAIASNSACYTRIDWFTTYGLLGGKLSLNANVIPFSVWMAPLVKALRKCRREFKLSFLRYKGGDFVGEWRLVSRGRDLTPMNNKLFKHSWMDFDLPTFDSLKSEAVFTVKPAVFEGLEGDLVKIRVGEHTASLQTKTNLVALDGEHQGRASGIYSLAALKSIAGFSCSIAKGHFTPDGGRFLTFISNNKYGRIEAGVAQVKSNELKAHESGWGKGWFKHNRDHSFAAKRGWKSR